MRAPRRRAAPSASRTRIPAPPPITKPPRSGSKGRDALAGPSLRVQRARTAANPPTPRGVIAASLPPAIMQSASPRWISRYESPPAWSLVVQAVPVAELGPLAPERVEHPPQATLTTEAGVRRRVTLPGPPLRTGAVS